MIKTIIIIILIILMIFYGGKSIDNTIEYSFFPNIKKLIKRKKLFNDVLNNNSNYLDITNDIHKNLIPNLISSFKINIEPHNFFYPEFKKNIIMIIYFNKKNVDFIKLLISNTFNKYYFYNLNDNIVITDLYPIYNNSSFTIPMLLFYIKKPYFIK